jgi:ABC-type glycerol-3-phosphate transport system permease component
MCTYGDRADCSRCGCAAVAAYRGAFFPFDFRTLLLIFGLMGLPGKRLLWPFLKTESVKPIKRTE